MMRTLFEWASNTIWKEKIFNSDKAGIFEISNKYKKYPFAPPSPSHFTQFSMELEISIRIFPKTDRNSWIAKPCFVFWYFTNALTKTMILNNQFCPCFLTFIQ